MQTIVSCGARIANPGEFSQRAFLNNKIDLTQAEAIADLIEKAILLLPLSMPYVHYKVSFPL